MGARGRVLVPLPGGQAAHPLKNPRAVAPAVFNTVGEAGLTTCVPAEASAGVDCDRSTKVADVEVPLSRRPGRISLCGALCAPHFLSHSLDMPTSMFTFSFQILTSAVVKKAPLNAET